MRSLQPLKVLSAGRGIVRAVPLSARRNNVRISGTAATGNPDGQPVDLTVAQDYLVARAGGERLAILAAQLLRAPMVTALYAEGKTFPDASSLAIRTLPPNRIPLLRNHHRLALPLLAAAWRFNSITSNVTLCFSSGWAHLATCTGAKVVYWSSPAKWLYQAPRYKYAGSRAAAIGVRLAAPALMRADRRAANAAHVHLCNSTAIQQQLRDIYSIDSLLLHPPVALDSDGAQLSIPELGSGYLLCIGRFLPYKHVDAVIAAMRRLPRDRLVVVGSGPLERTLRRMSPSNVVFLRDLDDAHMRWLYAHAALLVTASEEDFGLTPPEAASFGVPSVALRWGGSLDTVAEGTSGLFFDDPEPAQIAAAVETALRLTWDRTAIMRHSRRFDLTTFKTGLIDSIELARTAFAGHPTHESSTKFAS